MASTTPSGHTTGGTSSAAGQPKDWQQRFSEEAEKCFQFLIKARDNPKVPMKLRIDIAQDFLDRNPETTGRRKVDHAHEHSFTAKDLRHAADVAGEISRAKILPIKAEPA